MVIFIKIHKMSRNLLFVFLVVISLFSCNHKNSKITTETILEDTFRKIPDTLVHKSALFYDTKTSLWSLNKKSFSGYAVSFYSDNSLKEKIGILNGKKHNLTIEWYADGHYKHLTNYQNGKAHGDKKTWSPDSLHILVAHFKYVFGKPHGEQKKWYATGELFKKMNLNMGKEEGIQQAYRPNGALYTNYEAKEGRIFGLKKTALCYSLEDENIKHEK